MVVDFRWGPVLALCASWFWPHATLAWSDVVAERVRVTVDVDRRGAALVAMDVSLSVRGGRLEVFELRGLGARAAFDREKPPTLVGASGAKWQPEMQDVGEGGVRLVFPRATAPVEGRYRLLLWSRSRLQPSFEGAEVARFAFRLPGWQSGLERADVWIAAPSGRARPLDAPDLQPARVRRERARTRMAFTRLHLPRATAWEVMFEVPVGALATSLRKSPRASVRADSASGLGHEGWPWFLLALAFCAWGALRQRTRAIRDGFVVRAWSPWVAAVCLALGALGTFVVRSPWFSAAVVCLAVPPRRRVDERLDRVRYCGAAARRAARGLRTRERLGLEWPPDPLSLLGALCGFGVVALAWNFAPGPAMPWAACCFALACAGSTWRRGASSAHVLERTFQLAESLRVDGVALRVVSRAEADGIPLARLRCELARPLPGLERLEVAADTRPRGRGYTLLATASAGSACDEALSALSLVQKLEPQRAVSCHLLPVGSRDEVAPALVRLVASCVRSAPGVDARVDHAPWTDGRGFWAERPGMNLGVDAW